MSIWPVFEQTPARTSARRRHRSTGGPKLPGLRSINDAGPAPRSVNHLQFRSISVDDLPVCAAVFTDRYAQPCKTTRADAFRRVAHALSLAEPMAARAQVEQSFFRNLQSGAIGAGRILAICWMVPSISTACRLCPTSEIAISSGRTFEANTLAILRARRAGSTCFSIAPRSNLRPSFRPFLAALLVDGREPRIE